MGSLRIVTGGVQLKGQAMVLDALIASTIRSRNGVPITIESSKNITLSTRDREGYLLNRIVLGKFVIPHRYRQNPFCSKKGQELDLCPPRTRCCPKAFESNKSLEVDFYCYR